MMKNENDMYKVRMSLSDIEIQDISADDFDAPNYIPPTIVDLASLFYAAFPSGVLWQFGWELSKKLGVEYDSVLIAIDDIIEDCLSTDEKEFVKKYEESPHPGQSYFEYFKATYKRKENL